MNIKKTEIGCLTRNEILIVDDPHSGANVVNRKLVDTWCAAVSRMNLGPVSYTNNTNGASFHYDDLMTAMARPVWSERT